MLCSVELSLRWKFMATHPTITHSIAGHVDDAIAAAIAGFLPSQVDLNHKSRALIHTPQASGGLGFLSYGEQGTTLYAIASSQAPWPPLKAAADDAGQMRFGLSSKACGDALLTALPLPVELLGAHEMNSRTDSSVPWFKISAVNRSLRIDPAAWRLGLANFLRCEITYPTCGDHPPDFDGSQTCHRCGGPYRYPRHQSIQHAIHRSCTQHGILASEQFAHSLGVAPDAKRPDLLVYRSAADLPPLALDVSVPHQALSQNYNAIPKMWNMKQAKYGDWRADIVNFAPCIFSTIAQVHPRTLDHITNLESVASSAGFPRDCVARAKVALVNFELYRRNALLLRESAGTLMRDPEVADPE
jgi:hypothetical protein